MSNNTANAGKIKNGIEMEVIKFIQDKADELEKLTGLKVIELELKQASSRSVGGKTLEIHGFRFIVD